MSRFPPAYGISTGAPIKQLAAAALCTYRKQLILIASRHGASDLDPRQWCGEDSFTIFHTFFFPPVLCHMKSSMPGSQHSPLTLQRQRAWDREVTQTTWGDPPSSHQMSGGPTLLWIINLFCPSPISCQSPELVKSHWRKKHDSSRVTFIIGFQEAPHKSGAKWPNHVVIFRQ